jgi:glycosyltransferase involved in cell wall biosynthesis
MKVTFLLPDYYPEPIGGYVVVYEYANQLAKRGAFVTVMFGHDLKRLQELSWRKRLKRLLRPIKLRLLHRPLVRWFTFQPGVKLRFIPIFRPERMPDADAVIATSWETAGPVAALPLSKGRKFYLIQHYETWSGTKAAVDKTWHMPLHIIAISQWLIDKGRELGASEMTHIPNAIDHNQFRVTNQAARPASILSLYHTSEFKGVPDALAVLARIHKAFPDVLIRMFGVYERGADMPGWIEYHRDPAREQLAALYNQSSIYLSASLIEGWSLPPAEAMACGCLFVGTDSLGCRDYAESDVTALLSPPGDRDALYLNLARAITDPKLSRKIAERGTANIQTFSWDSSGVTMYDLITRS